MAAVLLGRMMAISVLLGSLAALTFNWSIRLGLLLGCGTAVLLALTCPLN